MKIKTRKPGPVRAAILSWFGIEGVDYVTSAAGVTSDTGMAVTNNQMLTLSATWACTRLISETIATLPLNVYERTSAGKRVAQQHPLQMVVHQQPNPDTTAAVHWEATVATMLLRGNARAEKLMVGGRTVGLKFLHPDRLAGMRKGDGTLEWRYTEDNGRQRTIPNDRIWNVPGFSLDGKCGVSVVQYGVNVFGAALAAEQAANKTFANGMRPTTVWKFPTTLRKEQREDARTAIELLSGAVNSGKPAVLEAGMDVTTVGIDPNDAQLLESRAFSVEEVCRWFRVPPFMVGHSEKSTSWGTGIEQQMIGFLTFTLAPWLRRIEQAIEKDLLTPAERSRYFVKFNVEGLLRADSAARAAFYAAMVNNGIFTRDNCREKEDLPTMGGNASVLTVQSAMVPLDSIGQAGDAEQARASLLAWLREPEAPTTG